MPPGCGRPWHWPRWRAARQSRRCQGARKSANPQPPADCRASSSETVRCAGTRASPGQSHRSRPRRRCRRAKVAWAGSWPGCWCRAIGAAAPSPWRPRPERQPDTEQTGPTGHGAASGKRHRAGSQNRTYSKAGTEGCHRVSKRALWLLPDLPLQGDVSRPEPAHGAHVNARSRPAGGCNAPPSVPARPRTRRGRPRWVA